MARRKISRTIFFPPRNPRIARVISITSPSAFRESIQTLKKDGITTREKSGLVLAQNRARAQLGRANLSSKERRQFREIASMILPPVTRRVKKRR